MHVAIREEEKELILGKLYVNMGKRNHVEGQIPGGILKITKVFTLLCVLLLENDANSGNFRGPNG